MSLFVVNLDSGIALSSQSVWEMYVNLLSQWNGKYEVINDPYA